VIIVVDFIITVVVAFMIGDNILVIVVGIAVMVAVGVSGVVCCTWKGFIFCEKLENTSFLLFTGFLFFSCIELSFLLCEFRRLLNFGKSTTTFSLVCSPPIVSWARGSVHSSLDQTKERFLVSA